MNGELWACGRSMSGYPGGFPHGFLNRLDDEYNINEKNVLFPFGGATESKNGWVINDIKPELGDTTHNVNNLPEKWENKFDLVLADPPYGQEKAENLYDEEHIGYKTIYEQCAKCVKPGGRLLILDFLVYINYRDDFDREKVIGVTTGPNMRIRALSVFRRSQQKTFELNE